MKTQKPPHVSLFDREFDDKYLDYLAYGVLASAWLHFYLAEGLSIQTPPSDNLLWLVAFGAAVVSLGVRTPAKKPMQGTILTFPALSDIARFWVVTFWMHQYLQWVLAGEASPLTSRMPGVATGACMVVFGISALFNLGVSALLSIFERESP